MIDDARRFAPSAARNRAVILQTLSQHMPDHGHVLEVASGSGEHITYFATVHPSLTFQPSDLDADSRSSIDAWTHHLGLANVAPAIVLDVVHAVPEALRADVIICINMIHIAPWSASIGLMRTAAIVLPKGGLLYLYGPYRRRGEHTAPTNAQFDADLKARNPRRGVRDLEAVVVLAQAHGFSAPTVEDMPANNLSVIFRRV